MRNTAEQSTTILAVGDIMTGCSYFHSLVGDSIPHVVADPDRVLIHEDVVEVLNEADLVFGNLECVLSEEFDVGDDGIPPRLMGPAESVATLADAGFAVLNIANNHILDNGQDYVRETMGLLEANEIQYVGNPLGEQRRVSCAFNGNEVTFDGFYVPDPSDESERERILSSLGSLDTEDQINVVSLHWGVLRTEHIAKPAPEQVELARGLIEQGVDVILGHHSHTFQPVESHEGGLIAYSLGNFVFDMWREKNRKSGILKLVVDGDDVRASILPIEQVDKQVRFAEDSHIRAVQDGPVEWESRAAYQRAARRAMRAHKLDVVGLYVRNFHRLPPEYHRSTLSRWRRKGARDVKNHVKNVVGRR